MARRPLQRFAIALLAAKHSARLAAAALGLAIFLSLAAGFFGNELPETLPDYDPEDAAAAQAARQARIDPDNPIVIWRKANYEDGESAAWWPKGESPVLAELVAENRLPPVAERVGPEPVVLEGVDGVGNYGGNFIKAEDVTGKDTIELGSDYSGSSLVRWSPYGYPIVPHLAKRWEIRDEYREFVFHLRRGVRWSDGHPLTAEDILYHWEHEANDPSVLDTPTEILIHRSRPAVIEVPDAYTLVIRFQDPYPVFLERMATAHGQRLLHSPKHYLEQFHPKLGDETAIKAAMDRTGISNSSLLYGFLKRWNNPAHPRLWPWVYRSPSSNPPYFFVRNPYYYAVDPEGNQLPYLDQYILQARPGDMAPIAAVNGELSFFEGLRFNHYTMAMSQRETGDYQVYHWDPLNRSDFLIFPNHNLRIRSDDPETVKKRALIQNPLFRRALSLAMDRETMSRIEYSGLMEPAQMAPAKESPHHYPKLTKAYVAHDPEKANELLDEIGLDGRDAEGMRTYADGSRLSLFFDYLNFTKRDLAQLIAENWQDVGLRIIPRFRAERIWRVDLDALNLELSAGAMNGKINPFVEPKNYLPTINSHWARAYGRWHSFGGLVGDPAAIDRGGVPPPPDSAYREAIEKYAKSSIIPDPEKRREAFAEVLDLAAENLWTINTGFIPPKTIIVKNGFRNVPRVAVPNWDFQVPANCGIETFFWEEPKTERATFDKLKRALSEAPGLPVASADSPPPGPRLASFVSSGFWLLFAAGLVWLSMRRPFIGQRLLIMIPTLAVVSVCVFTIIQIPPGDFITSLIAKMEAGGDEVDEEAINNLREMFELDKPAWRQYLRWIGLEWFLSFDAADRGLIQGNMGISMASQSPVNDVIGDRVALTIAISALAVLVTWGIALPIGIYSAVKQYSIGDYLATFIGFVGMSIPNFLLALILMFVSNKYFGVPITGLFSAEYVAQPYWDFAKFLDLMKHVWVPVLVLAVTGAAAMIRVMRGNLLDELKKPYVVTARAKGVRPLKLLLKYPVRLALNPFISGIGHLFPQLVSGGAIVALILSLPTVGPLLLQALQMEDMYLAASMLMALSLLGIIGTLVSDLLLMALDPRIRMEGGKR